MTGHRAVARCPKVFRKVLRLKNEAVLNMLFTPAKAKEMCQNFKVICLT